MLEIDVIIYVFVVQRGVDKETGNAGFKVENMYIK
jgi:hypothetical protein